MITLSPSEAVQVKQILAAPFTQQWLKVAEINRPSLGKETTIEGQALKSREAKGWEDCLSFLRQLPIDVLKNQPLTLQNPTIDFSQEKETLL